MPFAVKMGLGGTGFLGNQAKSKRAIARAKSRRKVLPGFPVERPFESIEDVREYLSGDKIVCLRCGKEYKGLGVHLQRIHGITPDQYREMYRIPWGYTLTSSASKEVRRESMRKRMDAGFVPPGKIGEAHKNMVGAPRRRCPHKAEVGRKNIAKTKTLSYGIVPCDECGDPFEKTHSHHKFCSDRCKNRAKRRYAKERYVSKRKAEPLPLPPERPCDMCGDVFQPTSKKSLYCSDECRERGRRRAYARRFKKARGIDLPGGESGMMTLPEKPCERCGRMIQPVRLTKKYCDDCRGKG